jgi:hypothetical protein
MSNAEAMEIKEVNRFPGSLKTRVRADETCEKKRSASLRNFSTYVR